MTEPTPIPRGARVLQLLPVLAVLALYGEAQDRWAFAAPLMSVLVVVWGTRWQPAAGFLGALFSGMAGAGIGLAMVSISAPQTIALPPAPSSLIAGGLAALATYYAVCASPTLAWSYGWALGAVSLQVQASHTPLAALALAATLLPLLLGGQSQWHSRPKQIGLAVFVALLLPLGLALHRGVLAFDNWLLHRMEQLLRDAEPPKGLGIDGKISADPLSDANVSERVMMELKGPPPGRLRSAVLTRLTVDGRLPVWSDPEFPLPGLVRVAPKRLVPPAPPPEGERRPLEVLMVEPLGGAIPTPAGTYALRGAPHRLESGWIWRTNDPVQIPLALERPAREELPTEDEPDKDLLSLPDKTENYKAIFEPIALGIIGDAATTHEKATRIEQFFTRNFLYSLHADLRPRPGDTRNVLQILIEEKRPAYCVYFASAMGVLLRSAGIKARVVQGFLSDEYNPLTGRTTVRSRDAHAWVEAWIPEEHRFVTFDPTPVLSRDQLLGRHQERGTLRDMVDAVASYARRNWIAFKTDPIGFIRDLVLHPVSWTIFVGLVLWRVWTGRGELRRKRRRGALGTSDAALREAHARYVKLLAKARVFPEPAEAEDELISRLRAERGEEVAAAASSFLDLYRAARFGSQTVTSEALLAALKTFATTLQASKPRQAA